MSPNMYPNFSFLFFFLQTDRETYFGCDYFSRDFSLRQRGLKEENHICFSSLPETFNKGCSLKCAEKYKLMYRLKCTQMALLKEKVLDHTIHLYTTYGEAYMHVFTVYQSPSNPSAQQWESRQIKSSISTPCMCSSMRESAQTKPSINTQCNKLQPPNH